MLQLPIASKEEIQQTKTLLHDYREIKNIIEGFKGIELSPEQRATLQVYQNQIEKIERAVDSIVDQELKGIIKHRFLQDNRYTDTLNHYASTMDERTVGRRINKGIESLSRRLKFML